MLFCEHWGERIDGDWLVPDRERSAFAVQGDADADDVSMVFGRLPVDHFWEVHLVQGLHEMLAPISQREPL